MDKEKKKNHSFVAYKCVIKYRERGNPLKDELRENIKNNEIPDYSFEELINDFYNHFKNEKTALEDSLTDKVVIIEKNYEKVDFDTFSRYNLQIESGRKDIPFKVISKIDITKNVSFTDDDSAIYPNNVFFYVNDQEIIAIFHHFGLSSCKTVLQSVFNNLLFNKGLYFRTDLICCNDISEDNLENTDIQKIIMEREITIIPSDAADEINKKPKKIIDSEIILNMASPRFAGLIKNAKDFLIKKFSDKEVITSIKTIIGSNDYNTGKMIVNLGGHKKVIRFDDFTGLIGEYDISDKLEYDGIYPKPLSLISEADKYYEKVGK